MKPAMPAVKVKDGKFPMSAQFLGSLLTIGGVIVTGKFLSNEISGLIGQIGDLAKQIKKDLDDLVEKLEETYQDNLNITLDKLDAFTRNKIEEVFHLFEKVQEGIRDDISLISAELRDSIRLVSYELEGNLKRTLIVGGEAVAYVVDRVTYNIILIVAVVALAVGLVAFPWVLLKTGLPEGFAKVLVMAFMAIFLAFFVPLALVPRFRGFIMNFTGIGLKARIDPEDMNDAPYIINHNPASIILGETLELKVWGVNLLPEAKKPTAKLAGTELEVKSFNSDTVVLDVSKLFAADLQGSYDLVLFYDSKEGPREGIEIKKPVPLPNLVITEFKISPSSPTKNQPIEVTIKIKNTGQGPVDKKFYVHWLPNATDTASPENFNLPRLEAGAIHTFSKIFSYKSSGKMSSIAIIDPDNEISETEETPYYKTIEFIVQDEPAEEHGLKLFMDPDFSGFPTLIVESKPNLKNLDPNVNDKASSLKPVGGKEAIVFEHTDYKGRGKFIYRDVNRQELIEEEFDEKISSIQIYDKGSVSGVTIYEHENFKGKSTFLWGKSYGPTDLQKVGFVFFTGNVFSSIISSIRIHGLQQATLIGKGGKKTEIKKSLASLKSIDLNDNVVAIEI